MWGVLGLTDERFGVVVAFLVVAAFTLGLLVVRR